MPLSRTALATLLLLAGLAASGCSLSSVRGTFPESLSLAPSAGGPLQAVAASVESDLGPGESAFWLLDRADYSFDARLALVDRAIEALDIQYFIWEKDPSSRLFAHRIVMAADRGVRVRVLLDDLTLNGQDREYYGLDAHPNIEIRTFNPWNRRSNFGRTMEFMFRFGRLNNRMHNKIIVADGHLGIVGGRNIGDRYFGLWDEFVQNDLDVMLAGPVLDDVRRSFDRYWNSTEAYPLAAVISRRAVRQSFDDTLRFIIDFYQAEASRLQRFPFETGNWDKFLESLKSEYHRGRARYIVDNPEISRVPPEALVDPLREFLAQARESVVISSPYMVPDEAFIRMLEDLEARGVEVIILTNSLASNNHKIAHSAYEQVRRRLIRMGVELYEARADSSVVSYYTTPPATPAYLGLHTKGAVVDGRYIYIGSANIDPRSLELNTELALFIDSTAVATRLSALIERDMQPDSAWRVTLEGKRRLKWTSSAGTVYRQPAQGFRHRLAEFFVGLLPIKQQS